MICMKLLNMLQWRKILHVNRNFLLENFIFIINYTNTRELQFQSHFQKHLFQFTFFHWIFTKTHTYTHTNKFGWKKKFLNFFCHFKHVFLEVNRRVLIFLLLSIQVSFFVLWSFWIKYELRQIKTLNQAKKFCESFCEISFLRSFLLFLLSFFYILIKYSYHEVVFMP